MRQDMLGLEKKGVGQPTYFEEAGGDKWLSKVM